MKIIINFLRDVAKIVFGSAVVGFFIPSSAGEVNGATLLGGIFATACLLLLAVRLSARLENDKIKA